MDRLPSGNTGWRSVSCSLQGIDSTISDSQPFLLITKLLEENRTRPPQFLLNAFLLPVLGQRHLMKQYLYLERISVWVSSPLSQWKHHQRSPSVLQLHRGMYCPGAPALQSPPKLLVVWFICISIFHSCTSLLHWCGSKWSNATGFTMDAWSGATMQNKASSVSCLWYALLK